MSFIRPELSSAYAKWREVIWMAGGALLALGVVARSWQNSPLMAAIAICVGLPLAVLALQAAQKVRFAKALVDPGVVTIDERRIGYFGPDGGGFVEMGALIKLDFQVFEVPQSEPVGLWHLRHADGGPVMIPMAAKGAEGLVDLFASLPGASLRDAFAAREAGRNVTVPIWRR